MAVGKTAVVWVLMSFMWTFTRGESEVFCVFMESCILPCSFNPGHDAVVHWIQETAQSRIVHSFYHNRDQLDLQDQRFKGRTSLVKDQISSGNASLRLTGVEVLDEGRYKCYTSTITGNQESFIHLKVEAPVGKVNIRQVEENNITCSSEGIYPEPQLTWSTSPHSDEAFKNTTEVQRTEQLLYSISNSMTLTNTNLTYTCNIMSGRHKRRATLFKTTSITGSSTETTITCIEPKTSSNSLVWRFNHSQIIVNQTDISESWKQQVKDVSESGSLMLEDLSSRHEGIYTCELSDAEETLITNTFVRIKEEEEDASNIAGITVGVVLLLLLIILVLLFIFRQRICQLCQKIQRRKSKDKESSGNEGRSTQTNAQTEVEEEMEVMIPHESSLDKSMSNGKKVEKSQSTDK